MVTVDGGPPDGRRPRTPPAGLPPGRSSVPLRSPPPGVPRPRVAGPARHGARPHRPKVGDPVPWAERTALAAPHRWLLLGGAAAAFALTAVVAPGWLPLAAVAAWALAAATAERPGYLAQDGAAVGGAVAGAVLLRGGSPVPFAVLAVLVLVGAIALGQALRRERSGALRAVGPTERADAVLLDLRDRAAAHRVPAGLPHRWQLDTDVRPAGGEPFSGDVLVVHRGPGRLEVVLADVSGKGHAAAGRALLLTGALGALLAEPPPGGVLAAANRYVLGHGAEDGFVTAVHATVDLSTGAFGLTSAGHPPAAHLRAGAGRWDLLGDAGGPPLGVVPEARFPVRRGRLVPGDALLLYTDGLVEDRRLDVGRGIDRLTGLAERVLARPTPTPAADLAAAVRTGAADDRALVVLRHLR